VRNAEGYAVGRVGKRFDRRDVGARGVASALRVDVNYGTGKTKATVSSNHSISPIAPRYRKGLRAKKFGE
jgi:hypothetical protein